MAYILLKICGISRKRNKQRRFLRDERCSLLRRASFYHFQKVLLPARGVGTGFNDVPLHFWSRGKVLVSDFWRNILIVSALPVYLGDTNPHRSRAANERLIVQR